jgi:hypothetical protein
MSTQAEINEKMLTIEKNNNDRISDILLILKKQEKLNYSFQQQFANLDLEINELAVKILSFKS